MICNQSFENWEPAPHLGTLEIPQKRLNNQGESSIVMNKALKATFSPYMSSPYNRTKVKVLNFLGIPRFSNAMESFIPMQAERSQYIPSIRSARA